MHFTFMLISKLMVLSCLFRPVCSFLSVPSCLSHPVCSVLSVLSCLIHPACSLLFVPFCLLSPVCSWPFCRVYYCSTFLTFLLVFLISVYQVQHAFAS